VTDNLTDSVADIRASVHRIEVAQTGLERRLDKTDGRISELDRVIIQLEAEQRATERIMGAEHLRLHEKVDDIRALMTKHVEGEDRDRRSIMALGWSTFLVLAGAVAWFAADRIFGTGPG
jgi:hypothetical protein